MSTPHRSVVPAALAGERLDRAVALLGDLTRTVASDLVRDGQVRVDGAVRTRRSERLAEDQVVEFVVPDRDPEPTLAPEADVTIPVVYADDDLVVVDKPAGLVVHPGAGNDTGTLVHGLLAGFPELAAVGEEHRPGIVHRLDKDTSGLLVVARTELAYEALTDALRLRRVTRRYRTLVLGSVDANRGAIDAPIGRSMRERTKMAVIVDGKEARTTYEVLERRTEPMPTTELHCELETGRTHQIRVHLQAIGHPVVGDARYGGARAAIPCPRQFLHAEELTFLHPATGERMHFVSTLPEDLADVRAALG